MKHCIAAKVCFLGCWCWKTFYENVVLCEWKRGSKRCCCVKRFPAILDTCETQALISKWRSLCIVFRLLNKPQYPNMPAATWVSQVESYFAPCAAQPRAFFFTSFMNTEKNQTALGLFTMVHLGSQMHTHQRGKELMQPCVVQSYVDSVFSIKYDLLLDTICTHVCNMQYKSILLNFFSQEMCLLVSLTWWLCVLLLWYTQALTHAQR